MDFLNHREVSMGFCQVFLISPIQRLRESEEIEISRQCCIGAFE
jgi:hypothetical protein